MTVEAAIFRCSICGEPSTEICVFCTKDACGNHRCERCKRCSDCCECEVPLSAEEIHEIPAGATEAAAPEGVEPQAPAAEQPPEESAPPQPATEAEDRLSNDPLF